MIERLRSYLDAVLPLHLGTAQYLRLFRAVFVLIFASSVVLHLLLQDAMQPLQTLVHAVSIGAAYTVVVALACAAVYVSGKAIERIRVWHIWSVSLVVFVVGYYLLPLDNLAAWIPDHGAGGHANDVDFLQLLPVWALVTYFFIQPYLTEGLTAELVKLRDINALLEAGAPGVSDVEAPIRFQSGKTSFTLEAQSIRNIAVDDHYCYVHYRQDDRYAKRDLAMPLRDALSLLPTEFVQVHRSHIVNLRHIQSVRRKNRGIRLVLDGDFEVPVSRHRLDQVLPSLRQQLALNK